MAPDHAGCSSAVRTLLTAEEKEVTMNLTRLERHQHPRPPHHELRQKRVLDTGSREIGDVENLYVDDDMDLQFMDVVTGGGLLGLGKKHHLVPVEAIAEEDVGSVKLRVGEQAVESAPTLADPDTEPEEELQGATREHYGYS
jgi:PRC-barrel domain